MFEKKETNILGVDIGTSSIKVLEVAKVKTGHALVTYGFVEDFQRDLHNIGKEDSTLTAQAIRAVVQKARCTTKRATAALPTYAVFTSLITVPQLEGDELDSAVHWEAKKIIPLPLDEIILDYKILNPKQSKPMLQLPFAKKQAGFSAGENNDTLKILITGAAKETVQKYTEIFQMSGLNLVSIETEMFALSRSIVGSQPGEIMIVEIGSAVTDIIIMQNGVPFFGRSLEHGGAGITRAISNSLHIADKRSEQLKRDIGIRISQDGASGGTGNIPDIIKTALEPIIHEIRYTIDLYKNHTLTPSAHSAGVIEKIILTGGTALMPGISEFLAQTLDIRVFVGDPWSFIQCPADLKAVLETIGPKFSVAIGLALRE
jgi:type IV pilus assembly protein PilM